MILPLIYMDIVIFAVLVAAFLASGVFIGWRMARSKTTEFRKLLKIMARADHILDNYIISIQGNAKVLGENLPVDGQRWNTSRDAIKQAADQMQRHVDRLRLIRRGLDPARTRVEPVNLARLIDQILVTRAARRRSEPCSRICARKISSRVPELGSGATRAATEFPGRVEALRSARPGEVHAIPFRFCLSGWSLGIET